MSKFDKIAEALFAKANDLESTGPSLPISWPDVDFIRPADLKYLEVQLFFNLQSWQGLTYGKMDQGLLQVAVVWPKGQGLIKPSQVAQQVADHFAKGTKLYNGSVAVKISAEPYSGFVLDQVDTVKLPVTIPWTA